MILGSAAAALGVAGGVSLASEAGIGPIYKFEEPGAGSGLPLDYNVAAMERFFNSRPLEVLGRTGEILAEILPFVARAWLWEYLIRWRQYHHYQ